MSIEISPQVVFPAASVADVRLIACPSAEELTGTIDKHTWSVGPRTPALTRDAIVLRLPPLRAVMPKMQSKRSVRGDEYLCVVDPGSYSVTYKLFDSVNRMSPDDRTRKPGKRAVPRRWPAKAPRVGDHAQQLRRPSASPRGA